MASSRNQQEELRRLMRERMADRSSTVSSIPTSQPLKLNRSEDSTQNNPFSKVTSSGKVICTICPGVTIKSWKIHQLSAEHKRNLKAFRAGQTNTVPSIKPAQPKQPPIAKPVIPKEPPRSILKNPLVKKAQTELSKSEQTTSEAKTIDDNGSKGQTVPGASTGVVTHTLKRRAPLSNDSDAPDVKQEKLEQSSAPDAAGAASTLPEGFFDDPRLDAKARNQEYRDPQDIEWERYQKALREEESKSEQVVEMDDERDTRERNIYEADEQIRNWETLRELEIRREEQNTKPTDDPVSKNATMTEDNQIDGQQDDEFDNEALDELMSWRQKSIKK